MTRNHNKSVWYAQYLEHFTFVLYFSNKKPLVSLYWLPPCNSVISYTTEKILWEAIIPIGVQKEGHKLHRMFA